MADREIPGFRYDPVKKRYFALTPQEMLNPTAVNSQVPISSEMPNFWVKAKHQRFRSVPLMLQSRQMGFTRPLSFQTDYVNGKLFEVQLSEKIDLSHFRTMEAVLFLKSTGDSIILQYKKDATWKTGLAEYHHRFTPDRFRENPFDDLMLESFVSINDAALGFQNSDILMYVGNNMMLRFGMANKVFRPIHENFGPINYRGFNSSSPIWCCASNDNTKTFGVGMKNLFTVFRLSGSPTIREVRGSVHSITFNKRGDLVLCGLHCGKMSIADLRVSDNPAQRIPVSELRMSGHAIDELILLDNEDYLIVGDIKGSIFIYDLRMRRKMFYYEDQNPLPARTSLSVDSTHNILCATGADHITRLWSISVGRNPVKHIKPDGIRHATKKTLSCLISDGCKLSTFIVQYNNAWIYDIFP